MKRALPPELAAPPIVATLLSEFIPRVKNDYELLEETSDGPPKISLFDLQMETLIFGLHCLDRAVFAHRDATYRTIFMDSALATACRAFAAALPDQARGHFLETFRNHWDTRQREYGAMKLFPGDDGALKGVLGWEYAKRICHDADVENPIVLTTITEGAGTIFTMMNKIAQAL
jgi:hypothetical protein